MNNTPQIPIPTSDVLTTPNIPPSVREGPARVPQIQPETSAQVDRNSPYTCDCGNPAHFKLSPKTGAGMYVCSIRDAAWSPGCDDSSLPGCKFFRWEDPSRNKNFANKRRRLNPTLQNNNYNQSKIELKDGFYMTKVEVDQLRSELGQKFMEFYDVLTDQMVNTKLEEDDPDLVKKMMRTVNILVEIVKNLIKKDIPGIATQLYILENSK